MKSKCVTAFLLVAGLALIHGTAVAQVTTGVPPYQSFGGGPDVINLGNLNVHYSSPVFSRAGRSLPFSYALAYDSSVWKIVGTAWTPATIAWGLTRDTAAAVGYMQVSANQYCGVDHGIVYVFSNFIDSAGTVHPVNATAKTFTDCHDATTETVQLTDGSGMTVFVNSTPSAAVILKSGEIIHPILSTSPTGTGNQADSNGNQITSTVNGTTTSFYDTLSTTTAMLTIDATNASSVKYKYASPANPAAQVVVSYKTTYTVQTHFACSGINEYGPVANQSLVDKITLADGSYYQFTYETTPGDGHTPHYITGRIASMRLPTGGTISYSYAGGNNGIMCSDGSTAGFDRTTPDGTWQYRRTGTSPAYTTTITSPPDPVTGQNDVTVINFQGNYETQRQIYQGAAAGTPLASVITCYNGNLSNCNTTAATTPFSQITKFSQLNGGSQARVDTFYDGYGSVTETDQYDFGASTPTRKTATLFGSYVSSSDSCTALTNNIVDHPCKVTVTDGSGNLKSKTTYSYDETAAVGSGITTNHVSVTGSRGNLTTTTSYVSSTATLTRTFKNYDTGNVYQSQDVNGQWTTYTYGACAGAFLTNVSVPLSLSRSYGWNCTGGVRTSATDENGKSTSASYATDQFFWRPENAKDQLLNTTNLSYPSLTRGETSFNFNGTVSTADVSASLDSLGRALYTQQKQSQSSGNYDSVQQTYDSFGRPFTATVPYVATIASPTPPGGTPTTTTYYDAMGRAIQTIDGGGGIVNTSYNLNDVYQEAAPAPTVPPAPATENTKRKQLEYDGLGRLKSVCEITSGSNSGPCNQNTSASGYLTTYTYDAAPNFNSLTVAQNIQAGGGTSQTRTYIYDMLGRLTSETNPESGQTLYFYDAAPSTPGVACSGTYSGDLVKKYDAQGNTTCYTYDALHRLSSVTYPGGPNSANTAKKYFVYDAATVNGQAMANALSRLAEAYTCTSACPGTKITDLGYSYSARGEMADVYESTPHSSGYYHVTESYWEHGSVKSLSNLAGLPTIYYGANGSGLDGEGRITQVTTSSSSNPTLVSGVNYTTANGTGQPIGSLTQVTLGSSDNDTFQYDANTGRLTQYNFNIGATSQTVQGGLTWNANGTLAKLVISDPFDTVNGQTCTFGYDDLARAKSANCGTAWNQTFTPDPFGNIVKNGTLSFNPGYDQTKNWFLSLPGLAYDNNGNLTNDGFHQYSWDAENSPLSIDTVNLTFDALGRMVEQARGSSYTQIVYAPGGGKLALMNGQTLQKAYCALPGGGTAVYTAAGLAYYRHADWLGSSRFASTPSRAKYFDVAYAPYGEDYADSGTLDLNFTGQNQDTVSGLNDFHYREFHPNSGRWIQPDPAGLGAVSMANPQTWNRYAYVANSPLNATDPLGLRVGNGGDAMICWVACGGGGIYYVNGMQVSAATAGTLIGGTFMNFGSTPFIGFNTGNDRQSYLYELVASDEGSGYAYFGVDYGTARSELGLPTYLAFGLAANNGNQQQNQQPSRLKDCAKAYYGFNTASGAAQDATRIALIPAAPIIPKAAVGLPQALGSGPLTNLLSYFSLGSGTAASGANIFRVAGRIGAPIAIASAVIDATAIGICASDYQGWLPHF